MRIERIEIDGFGRFRDAAWELAEGVTVLRGANEAGKTTLLNALRSLLFGFEPAREGRPSYPALAGGRRGGRLILRTAAGARWVVERHGERGGSGTLAVRAPNGNQGGQETLDRLLHGADRDLFTAIFAFGLGELQTLASLNADGVRARIYGAGAGLGGTSAVDLERRLHAEMDALHLPRGQRPLNLLLAEIEALRARIVELERQPEEYERAHRERDERRTRADALRAEIHAHRERTARLARLADAAPVAAELTLVEAELAAGDPGLDDMPPDAVAVLDRRLADLAAATTRLDELDAAVADARAARAGLDPDEQILAAADEIAALGEERAARAGVEERRAELRAAETRHAAVVAEQLRRAGGWEERRLVALDASIPAIEAIRGHEEALRGTRAAAADAEQRHRSEAEELERRRTELGAVDAGVDDEHLEARESLLRAHDALRTRLAAEDRSGNRPALAVPPWALGAAAVALAGGAGAGALLDAVGPGVLAGIVAAVLLVVVARSLSRPGGPRDPALEAERDRLLERLGLPPRATDEAVRRLADETARARGRRDLAKEQAAAIEGRAAELARRRNAVSEAVARERDARDAWAAWLRDAGFPEGLSPEGARELLAVADTARRAADERDHHRTLLAELARGEAAFAARADELLGRFGMSAPPDAVHRDARIIGLGTRLAEAAEARRRAEELDAAIGRLEGRRGPLIAAVEDAAAAVAAHLAALGCPDADALRRRAAQADARGRVAMRGRELRERLAGIAGSVDAIGPLVEAARGVDLPALAVERADLEDERLRLEDEERVVLSAIGALEARILDLEAADELGLRRQELAVAEGRAAALARRWTVRALALRLLTETRSRYERERQPDVVRAAEAYFERITDGRYPRILAAPGETSVRVETEGGETRATEQLSRGTAEQLYLALRFGLIEEFAQQAEPMPVVMDDILVNFDSDRASRAAAAIRELAERHQVLYFTCHPWTADLLDPSGARTVELEAAATIA